MDEPVRLADRLSRVTRAKLIIRKRCMNESLPAFLFETVLISASGVMAPGPMTTVTVERGRQAPHAGILLTLGHGIVETPLMLIVLLGLGYALDNAVTRGILAFAGAGVLLYMGVGMFRSLASAKVDDRVPPARSTALTGMMVSVVNPYFIIWWLTVGATLVFRAAAFGISGFALFALVHLSCDLLWCWFLSAFSYVGGKTLGERFQQLILVACGAALLIFSGKFILDGVRMIGVN